MEKVLLVVPHLDYSGRAKQVSLLVPALAARSITVHVCALGRNGPYGDKLATTEFGVEVLNRRKWFDINAWHRLWALLQATQPEVLHVWGLESLRFLVSIVGPSDGRIVVSDPFPPRGTEARPCWLDRWLLSLARKVVVSCPCEVESCRRLGLSADRVALIPPGVEPVERVASPPPDGRRWLVGVGPLNVHKGFRDAIWIFDILRYLYDDLHLALIGDGDDRERLRRFRRLIGGEDRLHLLGRQADVKTWLARAGAVLVPSWRQGGINAALEALALGCPVVAANLPALAEIVRDGETGLLFDPENKSAFARQVRRLLDDQDLGRRLGDKGRERVGECFSVAAMAGHYADLYRSL